jgi:hypothetical protein
MNEHVTVRIQLTAMYSVPPGYSNGDAHDVPPAYCARRYSKQRR